MSLNEKYSILILSNTISLSNKLNFDEFLIILKQNEQLSKQNQIIEYLLIKLLKLSKFDSSLELKFISNMIQTNFNIGIELLRLYLKNTELDNRKNEEIVNLVVESLKSASNSIYSIVTCLKIIKYVVKSKCLLLNNNDLISKIELFYINSNLSKILIDHQFFIFKKYLKSLCLFIENTNINRTFSKNIFNKLCDELILEQIEELNCFQEIKEDLLVYFLFELFKIVFYLDDNDINFEIINCIFYKRNMFRLDLVFNGKDDDLIVNFLNFCFKKETENLKLFEEIFDFDLNNHVMFLKLCSSIHFDYQILLDWLISNETNFLEYFLKYLKSLNSKLTQSDNFIQIIKEKLRTNRYKLESFKKAIQIDSNEELNFDKIFEFLKIAEQKIRQVKRSFPYNCEPLLRRLKSVNSLI